MACADTTPRSWPCHDRKNRSKAFRLRKQLPQSERACVSCTPVDLKRLHIHRRPDDSFLMAQLIRV